MKKINIKIMIYYSLISLLYPLLRFFMKGLSIVAFSDSCFILAVLFLLWGIVYSLVLHGDFDITAYIAKRSFLKQRNESFEEYLQEQKEKREDKFNYPLYNGLFLLVIALISAYLA